MEKLIRIPLIAAVAASWVILSHSEPFRSHFRLIILCAVASTGFLGGVLGLIARHRNDGMQSTPDERIAALSEVRRRYPAAVVTLIILMVWMIVIRSETFGDLRSHFWLVVLGLGASVGLLWAVPALIRRRWHKSAT
jgi:peptidoglycan/LPS O-acetylase OafA/YrhL